MTRAGSLMGTPNYMSPEQAGGKDLTPKADIFSLGVMLFELLTGIKPFMASDLPTVLNNIINQPVPPVPGPMGDIIRRMLAKSPDERPSASEVLARLQRPATKAPINPAIWIVGAVSALLIVASFFISSGSATSDIRAIRELNEKRRALAEAQRLYDQGKYTDSLQKYETYLKKYPMSIVAQNGRDRAREALAAPKHRRRPRRDEDISPRELLHRFKKAIRGK
jgi:serine/threonine protein kinase